MRRFFWLILVSVLLVSCTGSKTNPTATSDPQQIMTAVQQTVEYNLTELVALTPSATVTPTITETFTPSPTVLTPTADLSTASPAATATKEVLPDKAEMLSQSIADNSTFNPGAPFKVTWSFKNVGTTTWTTEYAAKFWSDSLFGSAATIPFSKEVKPGDTIDITMNFTAPTNIGAAKSSWWLQNPQGVNFYPFFIAIEVVSALPTPPTATPTLEPTLTPTVEASPSPEPSSTP